MKKVFGIFFMLVFFISSNVYSQELSRSKVTKKPVESTRSTEDSAPFTAVFGTTQFPISVTSFDYTDGKWEMSSSLTVGASFVLMIANLTEEQNGNYFVKPLFCLGPYISYGVKSTSDSSVNSICIGGIIGISIISVTVGYDLYKQGATIGIGTKIETFTFSDSMSTTIFNKKR